MQDARSGTGIRLCSSIRLDDIGRRVGAGAKPLPGSPARPGRGRRRLRRRCKLPLPAADWACVLVVQPSRDTHEVKVVRALRRSNSTHTGEYGSMRENRGLFALLYPPPNDRRVVARACSSRRTAIERHVADATHVVLSGPRPGRHRVPISYGDLHAISTATIHDNEHYQY